MILDARRDPPREPLDCDLCIVGAGPAGIALARRLDDGHRSIVLLDSGGRRYERATQALFAHGGTDANYPPLQSTHLGALGGSTQVWAGWCRPLDAIDFEHRPDVPASGWAIGRAELDPFYAQAHELLQLGPFDYIAGSPSAGANIAAVAAPPRTDACFESVLFRQSCVAFGTRFAAGLTAATGIRSYLHASATRIVYSADGRRALSLEVASGNGRRFEVRPRQLVLAAGGIETARLLLLSDADAQRGPVNRSGLVGRHFIEHVFVDGGTFVPARPCDLSAFFPRTLQGQVVRNAWSAHAARLRQHSLLNAALFFHPAYASDASFADERVRSLLAAWDMYRGRAVPHAFARRLLHAARAPHRILRSVWRRRGAIDAWPADGMGWRLRALCECASDPDNRIELSHERDALGRPRATVRWQIRAAELHSIRQTHTMLDESLRATGAGRLELPADEDDWRARMQPALHHLGTTRMHADPTRGVVDAHCRVHGIDNLYVAGGSVFPTGGYANPTLTILALTMRLAAHLDDSQE